MSYQCIRLSLRGVVFIVNGITGHFHKLIDVANNERGVGLFGSVRSDSDTEALTTRPAKEQLLYDALCFVFLFACMYLCVFDFVYHYALLYIWLLCRASDVFRYFKLGQNQKCLPSKS